MYQKKEYIFIVFTNALLPSFIFNTYIYMYKFPSTGIFFVVYVS